MSKKGMTLNEFQNQCMSTCTDSCKNTTYMSVGMAAEVGEIMDKIAKSVRKNELVVHNNKLHLSDETLARENDWAGVRQRFDEELAKEIFDVMWFCMGLADNLGYTFENVANIGLAKLRSRKERGVIIGNGDNR